MRVVIAEDSVLLRDGLVRLLAEDGHVVVAAAGDAAELVTAVERERPDVVVADVRMPPTHTDEGIRAAVEIRAAPAGLPVLVLSQYVEERYASELFAGGAARRRLPAEGPRHRRAARSSTRCGASPPASRWSTARSWPSSSPASRAARPARRSHRPRTRGARADGRGPSNAAVAERLVVTERAVEKHVRSIFQKLAPAAGRIGNRRVLAVLRFLEAAR